MRIDVVNRGFGYNKPPTVIIAPPEASKNDPSLKAAAAKAFLFKVGANKGRIERIELTDPGSGYAEDEIIKVKLSKPEMSPKDGGATATATAILEYEVGSISIVDKGSGYAIEKPIEVYVEPPPVTARINMNDPMMAQTIPANQPIPPTTIPSKEMRRKMPDASDPGSASAKVQQLAFNGGIGGGGGCIGRACYDNSVVATAFARAETNSYSAFRSKDDTMKSQQMELDVISKAEGIKSVSGASSGTGGAPRFPAIGSGISSSAQLLSLLPEGIGLRKSRHGNFAVFALDYHGAIVSCTYPILFPPYFAEYDRDTKRYNIRAASELLDKLPAGWFDGTANRPLDIEFGPRGKCYQPCTTSIAWTF